MFISTLEQPATKNSERLKKPPTTSYDFPFQILEGRRSAGQLWIVSPNQDQGAICGWNFRYLTKYVTGYEKKKRVDELANLAWVFSIGFVFINRSSFFVKHLEEAHSLASQKGGQKTQQFPNFQDFGQHFFFC